jgi:hypothetical protein
VSEGIGQFEAVIVKVVGGVGVEAMRITVRGLRRLGIVKGNCHIDEWPVREPHLEPPTVQTAVYTPRQDIRDGERPYDLFDQSLTCILAIKSSESETSLCRGTQRCGRERIFAKSSMSTRKTSPYSAVTKTMIW